MADAKRRYSEQELGMLIQRATELQAEHETAVHHHLTLQEIEQIAAEIGVDPQHLRAAARELAVGQQPDVRRGFWGGPFYATHEAVVEGVLTEAQWAQMVLEMERALGTSGKVRAIGPARTWEHTLKDMGTVLAGTHLSVTPTDGEVSIRTAKHYGGSALLYYVAATLFTGLAAGIALDGSGVTDLVMTLTWGGSVGAALAATRTALVASPKRPGPAVGPPHTPARRGAVRTPN